MSVLTPLGSVRQQPKQFNSPAAALVRGYVDQPNGSSQQHHLHAYMAWFELTHLSNKAALSVTLCAIPGCACAGVQVVANPYPY
jgi:hypothetical protein